MHYPPVPGMKPDYPIAAVPFNTVPAPTSPWVMPGKYTVVLTVDGQRYTQSLTIEMDPRVKTSTAELQQQFDLSKQVYDDLLVLQPVIDKAAATLTNLKAMREKATGPQAANIDDAIQELESLEGGEGRRSRRGPQTETLSGVRTSLTEMFSVLQDADVAPTTQAVQAVPNLHQSTTAVVQRWQNFASKQPPSISIQP